MTLLEGPLAVLIGPMGAGKTTVGRRLALTWRVGFRDTDQDIQDAERRSISDIFVDSGEAYFRQREFEAVKVALETHRGVLALGGGAVLDARTRAALADHPVVYLRVGLAEAASRVGLGQGRPLLLGNVRARMRTILAEREPLYRDVADLVVDTDGVGVDEVARAVDEGMQQLLRDYGASGQLGGGPRD